MKFKMICSLGEGIEVAHQAVEVFVEDVRFES
jgi:hypothetical protein